MLFDELLLSLIQTTEIRYDEPCETIAFHRIITWYDRNDKIVDTESYI